MGKCTEEKNKILINQICNKVFDIKIFASMQVKLYENRKFLEQIANAFFLDISNLLIDRILLEISKITDPAKSMGKENLSIPNLIESIDWIPEIKNKLDDINARLLCFREYVKGARNKVIAHSDKESFLKGKRFGEFPMEEYDRFMEDLELFCHICYRESHGRELGEFNLNHSGSVHDLIKSMKKALAFDKIRESASVEESMMLYYMLRDVDKEIDE